MNGCGQVPMKLYLQSCLQYYSAAQVLYLVLYYSTSGQSALTMKDIYCLLKVLAPLLVDTSYTPEPESDAMTELTMYLLPAIEIFQNINNITRLRRPLPRLPSHLPTFHLH